MRLFYALLRRRHMPNGHIHRGKDRIIKPITKDDYCKLQKEFEIEEKNLFYLRHPYLTLEQSHGHAKALGIPEKRYVELISKKKDLYKNVSIEERLGHLRQQEGWD